MESLKILLIRMHLDFSICKIDFFNNVFDLSAKKRILARIIEFKITIKFYYQLYIINKKINKSGWKY